MRHRPSVLCAGGLAIVSAVFLAALFPSAARAATIFGLVDTGELYASSDGGAHWSLRSALPARDAVALAAGIASTQLFLATQSGSFYRSDDAGMSWSAVGAVPATDVAAMVTRFGNILLISTSGSVFRSTDEGVTFNAVGAIPSSELVGATWWAAHFAVTRSGEVYRSTDGGTTWSAVGDIGGAEAVGLAVHAGRLYVLTSAGDVARSTDATGTSWTFVSTLSQSGMSALVRVGGELMASTEFGEMAASADGESWTWRGAIGEPFLRALGSDDPTTTGVAPEGNRWFSFAAPWPNPARSYVTLLFDLESEARTTVEVFDPSGRLVDRPIAGEQIAAGRVSRVWRPAKLTPGRYFLRAQAGDRSQIRSFVWLGPG